MLFLYLSICPDSTIKNMPKKRRFILKSSDTEEIPDTPPSPAMIKEECNDIKIESQETIPIEEDEYDNGRKENTSNIKGLITNKMELESQETVLLEESEISKEEKHVSRSIIETHNPLNLTKENYEQDLQMNPSLKKKLEYLKSRIPRLSEWVYIFRYLKKHVDLI